MQKGIWIKRALGAPLPDIFSEEWHHVQYPSKVIPLSGESKLLEALLAHQGKAGIESLLEEGQGRPLHYAEIRLADTRRLQIILLKKNDDWLMSLRDLSGLDRLTAVFVEQSRLAALGTATVTAAHEINNTLAALDSLIPLLEHPGLSPLERAKHMRNLQKEVDRATELIGDLVNLARQWRSEPEGVNPELVVQDVLLLKGRILESANIKVSLEPVHPPVVALVRRSDLEIALFQLLSNAVDALLVAKPPSPQIRVRILSADDGVKIRVEDNGPGLLGDPERAFGRFYSTRSDRAGLGLWVAQQAIEANNGRLELESTGLGGVAVSITLPHGATEGREDADEASTEGIEDLQAMIGLRILIVDDEQVLRTGVSNALRLYGPELVVEAANMTEALDAIEDAAGEFDVALLDVRLPDGTGIELYEQIGEIVPALQARIVFLVGERVEGPLLEFLQATKAPYVSKPFQLREVLHAIRQVVGHDPGTGEGGRDVVRPRVPNL